MKPTSIALLSVVTLGFLLSGCSEPPASIEIKPPEIVAAVALQQAITDDALFTGTVQASDEVEIRARVEGYLLSVSQYTRAFEARCQKVHEYNEANPQDARMLPRSPDGLPIVAQEDFEVRTEEGGGAGSIVEKDALLFVIDPEPFQVALDAANAKLAQSQAQLDFAQANYERYEQLLAEKAVTTQEFQRYKASRDIAVAQIAADRAAIRDAEIKLSYTVMRAPFRGRVDRRYVDPGNLVGGVDQTLLTTIKREDPMQAMFDVSEKLILELLQWRQDNKSDPSRKYPVFLKLDNEDDFVHAGFIDYRENRVDPSTGTAKVRGEFPNQDGRLYDGLNAQVRVQGQPIPDAILIHEEALGTDLTGKYILAVVEGENGKQIAEKRHVTLGSLQGSMRQILPNMDDPKKSIAPGEIYVLEGLQRVRDGSPVTVAETRTPKLDAPADTHGPTEDVPAGPSPAADPITPPAVS